jgi:hypothetical protein
MVLPIHRGFTRDVWLASAMGCGPNFDGQRLRRSIVRQEAKDGGRSRLIKQ